MKVTRLDEIKKILEEQNAISLTNLCERFQVSINTIRRDVNELEKKGLIKKVYGGITRNDNNAPEAFSTRKIRNSNKKQYIASLAAKLVDDNDVIFIDSGTTTMHMVPYLAEKNNLTILTSNVYVINEAFKYPQMNVISTGGTLYRPSNAFIGSPVLKCLKNYNINKVFLAATGFSISNGITNTSPMESEIKKYLVQNCHTKILLADSTKLDKISLVTFADFKDMDYFITDTPMPAEYKKYFQEHDITLITD